MTCGTIRTIRAVNSWDQLPIVTHNNYDSHLLDLMTIAVESHALGNSWDLMNIVVGRHSLGNSWGLMIIAAESQSFGDSRYLTRVRMRVQNVESHGVEEIP